LSIFLPVGRKCHCENPEEEVPTFFFCKKKNIQQDRGLFWGVAISAGDMFSQTIAGSDLIFSVIFVCIVLLQFLADIKSVGQ